MNVLAWLRMHLDVYSESMRSFRKMVKRSQSSGNYVGKNRSKF